MIVFLLCICGGDYVFRSHYNVGMQNIAVSGVNITSPAAFDITNLNAGVILDSGTTLATLAEPAYTDFQSAVSPCMHALHLFLMDHMAHHRTHNYEQVYRKKHLCIWSWRIVQSLGWRFCVKNKLIEDLPFKSRLVHQVQIFPVPNTHFFDCAKNVDSSKLNRFLPNMAFEYVIQCESVNDITIKDL